MAQHSITSFFTAKRKSDSVTDENEHASKRISTGATSKEFGKEIGTSWKKCLYSEMNSPYYKKLIAFVNGERKSKTIYPKEADVFSWTQFCKLDDVKVIILGQDPYHGPNQAHGLCFSVKLGINPPPSLVNIFKTVKNDYPNFKIPYHGYLAGWARQGVLMLNAVLTVERSKANSHKGKGWEKLTDHVIKYISNQMSHCVFLLWGKPAQDKAKLINSDKHHILKSVHPSPLSAHRGFFTCEHFKLTNEYLAKHKRTEIDWSNLPDC